jgi:hypothetical protein
VILRKRCPFASHSHGRVLQPPQATCLPCLEAVKRGESFCPTESFQHAVCFGYPVCHSPLVLPSTPPAGFDDVLNRVLCPVRLHVEVQSLGSLLLGMKAHVAYRHMLCLHSFCSARFHLWKPPVYEHVQQTNAAVLLQAWAPDGVFGESDCSKTC